ncbi:MAG: hypothetical protein EA365_14735 [Gloeocapsa sp. DLM2.Bin57]|nr:MAG: hypothetical protein EA365_14735 [Gloeocapsa sp. DLM2.Bin57]
MIRKNLPRLAIATIAVLGLLETAYLTLAELAGKAEEICPTSGCVDVLNSPYSKIFGLPLTLFGFFAYSTVAILAIVPLFIPKKNWDKITWSGLLFVTTTMAVSSLYLMYVMFFTIQALCPYCLASALLSTTLFLVTLLAHKWHNWRQLTTITVVAAIASLTGVMSVYANVDYTASTPPAEVAVKTGQKGPPVTTESTTAEISLAEHLKSIDAKVFIAYTCPHCHEQKQLFGKEATSILNSIECHPNGENAQPQLCENAGIRGVPTWEINGELYPGLQPLERLAQLSGYTGTQEFVYPFPY